MGTHDASIVVDNVSKDFTLRLPPDAEADGSWPGCAASSVSDTFNGPRRRSSFTVQQGESIGLMGLNGSGKSTLLKLISGVMRPDEGRC